MGLVLLRSVFVELLDVAERYMPQIPRYPENLRVREIFEMIKDLRGRFDDLDEEDGGMTILKILKYQQEGVAQDPLAAEPGPPTDRGAIPAAGRCRPSRRCTGSWPRTGCGSWP